MDTTAPFREKLKILGRVANEDDLQLSIKIIIKRKAHA